MSTKRTAGGDRLSLFSESVGDMDDSTEDAYPTAKHLGKWWDTPPYAEIVAAEAEVVRFFRKMVDEGWVELAQLPEIVDKIRKGIPSWNSISDQKQRFALQRISEFFAGMRRRYNGAMRNSLDEILRDTKSRARCGRKLWRDEKYWPQTTHRREAAGGGRR